MINLLGFIFTILFLYALVSLMSGISDHSKSNISKFDCNNMKLKYEQHKRIFSRDLRELKEKEIVKCFENLK